MRGKNRELFDWIGTILLALVISLTFRVYVAEARWVPSESMLPTIRVGDRLIIDKLTYRFREPRRGEIITFRSPPSSGLDEVMIKRVIGLPGDTICIKSGTVYLNGKPLTEPYELDRPIQDYGPVTVPSGSLFVMGDNRNNSFDSRYWGCVPRKLVEGRAWARYYPFNSIRLFVSAKLSPSANAAYFIKPTSPNVNVRQQSLSVRG